MPRLRLVGPDDPTAIFDDLEALRKDTAAQPTTARPAAARRRHYSRETFARIPHDRAIDLGRYNIGGPAWLILIELDRLILLGRGRNPVRLTNRNLKKAGVIDHTKIRALRQLEAAGVIRIEASKRGRSPLVSHLWFPLQD